MEPPTIAIFFPFFVSFALVSVSGEDDEKEEQIKIDKSVYRSNNGTVRSFFFMVVGCSVSYRYALSYNGTLWRYDEEVEEVGAVTMNNE